MFLRILFELFLAVFLALAIIYALTYSFYSLFLAEGEKAFSFKMFVDRMKNFTKRDSDEHRSYDKRSG